MSAGNGVPARAENARMQAMIWSSLSFLNALNLAMNLMRTHASLPERLNCTEHANDGPAVSTKRTAWLAMRRATKLRPRSPGFR
ncbi:hypothetical protein LMG28614_06977 [Paraburkholderia ultramafica]|uniref:Uncharacterized protein n=1 Tax=Paraburkholderia ultramafica TaxID=1544867 RepID=A0A6S7D745_9BURK|nr:hypothetical protein LMG28614_06977 [Paraburkholderia ultramafica]